MKHCLVSSGSPSKRACSSRSHSLSATRRSMIAVVSPWSMIWSWWNSSISVACSPLYPLRLELRLYLIIIDGGCGWGWREREHTLTFTSTSTPTPIDTHPTLSDFGALWKTLIAPKGNKSASSDVHRSKEDTQFSLPRSSPFDWNIIAISIF